MVPEPTPGRGGSREPAGSCPHRPPGRFAASRPPGGRTPSALNGVASGVSRVDEGEDRVSPRRLDEERVRGRPDPGAVPHLDLHLAQLDRADLDALKITDRDAGPLTAAEDLDHAVTEAEHPGGIARHLEGHDAAAASPAAPTGTASLVPRFRSSAKAARSTIGSA